MRTKYQGQEEKYKILTMAVLLSISCFLIYYFHGILETSRIFTHFFYVPVILACAWWGRRGLAAPIFLVVLLSISHILIKDNSLAVNDYIRSLMFVAIGSVVAMLSERNAKAENKSKHLNVVLRAIRKVNQLIIKEKDHRKLLKGACDNLVETRGYYNAWIALLDESGVLVTAAESGLGEKFSRLLEILKRGDLMKCCREALGRSSVLVIANPVDACDDCPLTNEYGSREAMSTRLEYEDKVYGIMTVSVPSGMATDREEQSLFEELAGDIAFALHTMEVKEGRKRSDEELKESEEIYRTLVESSTDAILMMDKERKIISCNQAFLDLFGYDKNEIEGRSIRVIHKSDESFHSFRDTTYPVIDRDGFIRVEWDFMRKNGTIFPVETVTSAIKSPDGPIRGYVAIIRDTTDRKKLETQLQQAQKMEAVGTLAGGVAHDFNNLLTTIIGNADLMSMNLSKDDPLCESIAMIKRAGQSAASLTRQLLAFSRKQVIQPKILDLNEVIRGTEKMLGHLIREDVEMKTSLEPTLWPVKIDPGQTEQVMVNLVVNARDAMPNGGKLTIKTANVDLDEDFFHNEGIKPACGTYAMIAVSDTGIGMDEETQLRIFEPFFTTKERSKGTGLGLATVYGIVKQNAGYIFAHSEPGQGATFKVYLPRVEGEVTSFEKEQGPMNGFRGSETILLVEDDDTLRDLAKKILQKHGYSVLDAHNGEKALRVTDKHHGPLHLILTDVVMPGMNGREVVERLQSLRQEIKVLYMSGYLDNEIAPHGILDPGINFIEKPFTPKSLAMKVRRVLDQGN